MILRGLQGTAGIRRMTEPQDVPNVQIDQPAAAEGQFPSERLGESSGKKVCPRGCLPVLSA